MIALPSRELPGHWAEDHPTYALVTTDPLGKLQESKIEAVAVDLVIDGLPGTVRERIKLRQ